MKNREELEKYFHTISNNLHKYIPDGILEINIRLLRDLGLLEQDKPDNVESSLKSTFDVIETGNKMMLINKRFVIWIVSDNLSLKGATYVVVALNQKSKLKPELCFSAKGVYNTTSVVIRVLDKLLTEILENQTVVDSYENAA